MKEPTYTAATLRLCGHVLPDHIPDHAWIFEKDTQNLVGSSWADGRITSVRNVPTFPPEKFHYYPQHGTARLLVSRNRREGRYCGRCPRYVEADTFIGLLRTGTKHYRQGKLIANDIPLRFNPFFNRGISWEEFKRRLHIMGQNNGNISSRLI